MYGHMSYKMTIVGNEISDYFVIFTFMEENSSGFES